MRATTSGFEMFGGFACAAGVIGFGFMLYWLIHRNDS
jgi:hypothetical protein